ncbi:PEBP family protein [Thioalkalivibrio sp. K90mix]|uniref:YbhB/YbcL family Raf kinase inhibitor-like protein n=1 Tax=unclassified Thioalkalivibrio TaxID=2621013 RepID=UPI00019597A2|nr:MULTISPECIES: YbhB/YbcL family Raf kinase inhibitor-like protein [unclassified Thioalkalivibrio]ADC72560.1 PEBP family protein [Thioalkalivibrio sp. K90mix]
MGFALSDLQLSSSAFGPGQPIPKRHTGEGEDTSPALKWSNLPRETRSLAVICHDPDAPLIKSGTYGFVHWVLYNLPPDTDGLPEAATLGDVGENDFGGTGYGGPMPPEGHSKHHYFFWLLALDRDLQLPAGLTLWQFLDRAEPHVIGMNRLVGTYQRD